MTQLVLDADGYNITLPESRKGGYTARKTPLSSSIEMITGRTVVEYRGSVWQISYQYGYFDNETAKDIIAACEKGRNVPIRCGFIAQGQELTYSDFWVTDFTRPKFMWSRSAGGEIVSLWADFSVELREVKPSD